MMISVYSYVCYFYGCTYVVGSGRLQAADLETAWVLLVHMASAVGLAFQYAIIYPFRIKSCRHTCLLHSLALFVSFLFRISSVLWSGSLPLMSRLAAVIGFSAVPASAGAAALLLTHLVIESRRIQAFLVAYVKHS